MAYQFVNNFSQTLAAPLSEAGTTLELDGGGDALIQASAARPFPLTAIRLDDGDEVHREIMYVTGADGDTLTVVREREGTVSPIGGWQSGDVVECRLTAASAMASGLGGESVVIGDGSSLAGGSYWSVVIGRNAVVGTLNTAAWDAVSIGSHAAALSRAGIAIGNYASAANWMGIAVGQYAVANGMQAVAIGEDTKAGQNYAVSLGFKSEAAGNSALAAGNQAKADSFDSIAIGRAAHSPQESGVAIGAESKANFAFGTSVGSYSRVFSNDGLALGVAADCQMPGGARIAAIPYLPTTSEGASLWWGAAGSGVTEACRRCSPAVVISTPTIDLTDSGAIAVIDIPAGGILFIDRIDIVAIGAVDSSGDAIINVGTTQGGNDLLEDTVVGLSSAGGRVSIVPLSGSGATSVHISVSIPDSGNQLNARLVFHGYVMA